MRKFYLALFLASNLFSARSAFAVEPDVTPPPAWEWLKYIMISGYVQPRFLIQHFNDSASPLADAKGDLPDGVSANDLAGSAKKDGTTTNGDSFRLRRVRLKVTVSPTSYTRGVIEIDPASFGTWGNIFRETYAEVDARWHPEVTTSFAMGAFKVPFNTEIEQSSGERPFIDRSFAARSMFPGDYDLGARAITRAFDKKYQLKLAVMNGYTFGEKAYGLTTDLNRSKDGVAHITAQFGPVQVGLGGYIGRGQRVDAAAATVFEFPRHAVNAEVGFVHEFSQVLGKTKLYADVTLARNMDRGVLHDGSLPRAPGENKNELGGFVRVEQNFTKWSTLGLRYDVYTPELALKNNARNTYSVVGVAHFTEKMKLMLEYNYALDNIHLASGAALSKVIQQFSVVLQARM